MVGETGAGKSSTLNTFATAISDKDAIIQDYRVAHHITELDGEKSITKTVSFINEILINCQSVSTNRIGLYNLPLLK